MSARVALIDSGVNRGHPHLRPFEDIEQGPDLASGESAAGEQHGDLLGHGTAAAAAILDLDPRTRILSIRVFGSEPRCPLERLLRALDAAVEWRPHLVNLSLGTRDPSWVRPLEKALWECRRLGIKLVSPAASGGMPSFPGFLEGAEGVLPDPNLPRDAPERRPWGERIFWYASPYPRSLPGLPRHLNLKGPSMAAANLTGYLASRLRSDPQGFSGNT